VIGFLFSALVKLSYKQVYIDKKSKDVFPNVLIRKAINWRLW